MYPAICKRNIPVDIVTMLIWIIFLFNVCNCQVSKLLLEKRTIDMKDFNKTGERVVVSQVFCSAFCLKEDCDCYVFQENTCTIGRCGEYSTFGLGIKTTEILADIRLPKGQCTDHSECLDSVKSFCKIGKCIKPGGVLLIGGYVNSALTNNVELVGDCEGSLENLPISGVFDAASTILDGLVYHCGGVIDSTYSNACYVRGLDGVWTSGPNLNEGKSGLTLNAVGDKIVAAGGWDGSLFKNTVEVMVPGVSTWVIQTFQTSPNRRGSCSLTMSDTSILMIGGRTTGDLYIVNTDLLDIVSGVNTKWADLITEVEGPGCAVYEGNVLVAGGYHTSRGFINDVYTLDITVSGSPWISAGFVVNSRSTSSMHLLQGVLTVFGGSNADTSREELIEGVWRTKSQNPPRFEHTSVVFC